MYANLDQKNGLEIGLDDQEYFQAENLCTLRHNTFLLELMLVKIMAIFRMISSISQ